MGSAIRPRPVACAREAKHNHGMEINRDGGLLGASAKLISATVIIASLYFAREVLIPFSLAVLLSFLLAPMVIRLRHWGLGRIAAVAITVSVSFVILGALAAMVSFQIFDLVDDLPQYQQNIHQKIQSLRVKKGGVLQRSFEMLQDVSKDLAAQTASPHMGGDRGPESWVDAKSQEHCKQRRT